MVFDKFGKHEKTILIVLAVVLAVSFGLGGGLAAILRNIFGEGDGSAATVATMFGEGVSAGELRLVGERVERTGMAAGAPYTILIPTQPGEPLMKRWLGWIAGVRLADRAGVVVSDEEVQRTMVRLFPKVERAAIPWSYGRLTSKSPRWPPRQRAA